MNLFGNPDPWTSEARCVETDADVFFPEPGFHAADVAKKICQQCEVVAECLEAALKRHERYGVYGGHTPKERELISRQRRKKAGGVPCVICHAIFKGSPQHQYCSKDCHLEARRLRRAAKAS